MATVEQILGEAGYRLQIGAQHDNFRAIEEQVADFHARNVDGIICCSHTYLEFGAKIAPLFESFPNKVFIHEPVTPGSVSFVAQDQRAGIRMLVQRLISRGCRAPYLITPGITDCVHYIRINAFLEIMRSTVSAVQNSIPSNWLLRAVLPRKQAATGFSTGFFRSVRTADRLQRHHSNPPDQSAEKTRAEGSAGYCGRQSPPYKIRGSQFALRHGAGLPLCRSRAGRGGTAPQVHADAENGRTPGRGKIYPAQPVFRRVPRKKNATEFLHDPDRKRVAFAGKRDNVITE